MRSHPSTRSTATANTIIPLQISQQRRQDAFWGQISHFRNIREKMKDKKTYRKSRNWRSLQLDDHEDNHVVKLSNCHQILYSGEIGLGSPEVQRFRVDFDTGSSDLWVISALCDDTCDLYDTEEITLSKYDEAKSETYETLSASFRVDYADGEWVDGHHAKDTLTWAGYTVPDTVFAQAFHLGDYDMCVVEDGVFGLAFSSLSSNNLTSPLLHVMNSNVLPHNVFSLFLDPQDDYDETNHFLGNNDNISSSRLIVGGIDTRLFDGCLAWHDVEKAGESGDEDLLLGFWGFALQNVHVTYIDDNGEEKLDTLQHENIEDKVAILDSGSTFIVGPLHSISIYLNKINATCYIEESLYSSYYDDDGASIDEIPCDNLLGWDYAGVDCESNDVKPLVFETNSINITIDTSDLILEIETTNGDKLCFLKVQPSPIFMPGWILGDSVLQKYYAAFDRKNERIGFAPSLRNSTERILPVCDDDLVLDLNIGSINSPTLTPIVQVPNVAPVSVPFTSYPTVNVKDGFPSTFSPVQVTNPIVNRTANDESVPLIPIIIASVALMLSFYITRVLRQNHPNRHGPTVTTRPVRSLQLPAYDIDDEHEVL